MKSQLLYMPWPKLCEELLNSQDDFYAVVDSKVKVHLPAWMQSSKSIFWIHHPEAEKNLKTFESACQFFLELGISRHSTLFAIGGGATTDLAGFVAASLLRGINWISVPTTLLAMVDGSLGGKVAVNMPQGKNLVGAFHAPEKVYLCQEFLATLDLQEIQSAKGEILKYGFLSQLIYQMILKQEKLPLISYECAQFKQRVVESDFKEKGERILLNLGHTLGHAFESTLGMPHGLAVAMGMKYLFELFHQEDQLKEWEKLVSGLELPLEKLKLSAYPAFSLEKFTSYLLQDKKKKDQSVQLIMVNQPGECRVQEILFQELIKKIEAHEEFNR